MSYKAIILGYSGHAYVVIDAALETGVQIVGYCEKKPNKNNPYDLQYLGDEEDIEFDWDAERFLIGIGDNYIRERIAKKILSAGGKLLTVIHPSACISKKAIIGQGVFINANVSINAFAAIGDHCILNTGCIIEHECKIGHASHIAPGAVLAGNVEVGDRVFLGANSVVKQGVKIGANAVVGAGAVVIHNIAAGEVVVGNPAKCIIK